MEIDGKTLAGILLYVSVGIAGDVLLSRGMRRMPRGAERKGSRVLAFFRYIGTTPVVIAGIACLALSFGTLLALLSWEDVSLIVPSRAMTYLFLTLMARWILHERIPPRRWVGVSLVSVGVMLVLASGDA
jgi:drug/metabolite transporter (DMT)-like permease